MTGDGPKWLGIGAQRCGTTWFTDLLTQHPRVDVPDGIKEHNELFRFGLMRPWDDVARKEYVETFAHEETLLGEFSPSYMRTLWVCDLTLEVLPDDAPIIVMVRDPLDRFASALRHMAVHAIQRHQKRLEKVGRKKGGPGETEEGDPPLQPLPGTGRKQMTPSKDKANFLDRVSAAAARRYVIGRPDGKNLQDRTWLRYTGGDATWGGMYGAQMAAWSRAIPKERFVMIQYEKMKRDPQKYVNQIWERIGLDPVPLKEVTQQSTSSTRNELWVLEDHPHLVKSLRATYRADAELLAKDWDIDLSLWKRLMDQG